MTARAPRLPFSLDPLIAEAKRRARRRWLIIALSLALLAAGTVAALALRSVGPFGASDPQAVLGSETAAALGQRSVHWSESRVEDMMGSWALTADVTARSGAERLTIPGLSADGKEVTAGNVDIRLVDGVVYVKGNPIGLEWLLVLTDMQAARYAGQWISFPRTDRLYDHVSDGLTLASVVHQATSPNFGKGLSTKMTTGRSHGTPVTVIEEGDPKDAYLRLSVEAGGTRLPVAVYAVPGLNTWFRGSFSKWNEPVHVTAPSRAVPIATVRRS